MGETDLAKKAMVAGAAEALAHKRKTNCSDDQAIAHVVSNMNMILAKAKY